MICQIGKDLLLPELPLTIRLIGLRVTKLKDLRAAEPAGGIKRVSVGIKLVNGNLPNNTVYLVSRSLKLATEKGQVGGRDVRAS